MKIILTVLSILVLCLGCVSIEKREEEKKEYIGFAYAPNIQYLTSFGSEHDLNPPSNFRKFVIGNDTLKENKIVIKPYGIAVANGKVFVNDGRVMSGYWVIDLEQKSFTLIKNSDLKGSVGIAVDKRGYKFLTVPNIKGSRVQGVVGTKEEKGLVVVYDGNDNFMGKMEFPGRPLGVAVSGDKIFVTDIVNHRVVIIDKLSLEIMGSFGKAGKGDSEFQVPKSIVAGFDGLLYIADVYNGKIKVFNQDGEFISQYGYYSKLPGSFIGLEGVAVDKNGVVYTVDAKFRDKEGMEEIQVFDVNNFYPNGEKVPPLKTSRGKRKNAFLGFFQKPYAIESAVYMPAGIVVDYENIKYFQEYIAPGFNVEYLVWLTSQYAPEGQNITVFAYGTFNK